MHTHTHPRLPTLCTRGLDPNRIVWCEIEEDRRAGGLGAQGSNSLGSRPCATVAFPMGDSCKGSLGKILPVSRQGSGHDV